ncbi:3-keto-disaccharide hydrolase [Sphingomonas qomolangmaensis]|uniref:DUF1080 domain-containing protein n=1 Tax=Sphingomonas qomolangmaensis TaxID=2918765 RepID=A0ABY5L7Z0_9SPHN|nr:DUF1080 domain-containing protein [Sphingomonas qomolangmaensis]UUL82061.1 DUF1080 domain-containing protein [Sphingomonas qomolangmaensis]
MKRTILTIGALASLGGIGVAQDKAPEKPGFRDTPMLPGGQWHVHDSERPAPTVVTPAPTAGAAPSDAIVLFDGSSLDAWTAQGTPWKVEGGIFTVPARVGGKDSSLSTKQSFGDVQLHLEFRSPTPPTKSSQDRGNSGIWFMQRYEIQILDGYQNPTYADGTVGAIYAWKPPLVNASRKPGEWQSYDVVFERPRFGDGGKLLRPAYITAFLNGVLVQHRQPWLGTTVWRQVGKYEAHGDAAPIQLQDHDSPVSFRNIWVRPLPEAALSHDFQGAVK